MRQTGFLFIYKFIVILFCKGPFVNAYRTNYRRSHRGMFLNSHFNERFVFYDGSFIALVNYGTTSFFLLELGSSSSAFRFIMHTKTYIKQITV